MSGNLIQDLLSNPVLQYRIAFWKAHPYFTIGMCIAGIAWGLLYWWVQKEE